MTEITDEMVAKGSKALRDFYGGIEHRDTEEAWLRDARTVLEAAFSTRDEFDDELDAFLEGAEALLPPAVPEDKHGFPYIRSGGWSFDADEETLDGAREAIRAFAALAVYLQKSTP